MIPEVEKLLADASGDEKTGMMIVRKALEEPVKQIAKNPGLEGSVIVAKIKESEVGVGFNAYEEKYQKFKKLYPAMKQLFKEIK